jgi:hypothetical protein
MEHEALYATVAQIVPVLILALVIEVRIFQGPVKPRYRRMARWLVHWFFWITYVDLSLCGAVLGGFIEDKDQTRVIVLVLTAILIGILIEQLREKMLASHVPLTEPPADTPTS